MTDAFDDFEPIEQPVAPAPVPVDQERCRVSTNGLTIEFDLRQMLQAIDPNGRWLGYDPDTDEDRWGSDSMQGMVVEETAKMLTKAMRTEVRTLIAEAVRDQVMAQIGDIVREELENGVVQLDQFGRGSETKPLSEVILATANDALSKPIGDSFGGRGRPTVVQKIIDEAVGNAFRKELAEAVAHAKKAALAAVESNAAQVLRETIERASRGL